MKRFYIRTFGCQMNKHDSERISGTLIDCGYRQVDDLNNADLIVYNTCCVRKHADDRLYGNVAALKGLKREKPEVIIAVGGCLAQKDGERLQKEIPHIDIVFGTANQDTLPGLVERAKKDKVCDLSSGNGSFFNSPVKRESLVHAWIPITVGCDNFCSYCIVPHVRGAESSRPMEAVLSEIENYVSDGVIEVTLLGQNVNSYGRDLYKTPRFAELLKETANIKGMERVRFTTSHPKDLSEKVIDTIAGDEKVCSHIHLPVQAGSNKVLGRMNRGYTREDYLALTERIRKKIDDISITTDVMVGFPGETEADFTDTLDLMETVMFDQAFMFIYSTREGTKASEMPDQVPDEIKSERFERLVEVQNRLCLESNESMVGKKYKVFIEGKSKKSRYNLTGRTSGNKLVHIAGDNRVINSFINVQIKEAFSWFLIGERS